MDEIKLLDKGLSFIPTRKVLPISSVINSQNQLLRSIKLKDFFRGRGDNFDKKKKYFVQKKNWTPSDSLITKDTMKIIHSIQMATNTFLEKEIISEKNGIKQILTRDKNNISRGELGCLRNLQNNAEIIIKEADKEELLSL